MEETAVYTTRGTYNLGTWSHRTCTSTNYSCYYEYTNYKITKLNLVPVLCIIRQAVTRHRGPHAGHIYVFITAVSHRNAEPAVTLVGGVPRERRARAGGALSGAGRTSAVAARARCGGQDCPSLGCSGGPAVYVERSGRLPNAGLRESRRSTSTTCRQPL
jgi:hypothetical protein